LFQVQTSRQHPINLIVYISFFFFFIFHPLYFLKLSFWFCWSFFVVCCAGSEYFWFSRDLSVL
jgi:hypothetical protein